jgi:hypothetical protein
VRRAPTRSESSVRLRPCGDLGDEAVGGRDLAPDGGAEQRRFVGDEPAHTEVTLARVGVGIRTLQLDGDERAQSGSEGGDAVARSGASNDDIARRLSLSPLTVKTHLNRTMAKVGARDRGQLVAVAYVSGLAR